MPKKDIERRINQTPSGTGAGGVLIVPSSANVPPTAGPDIRVSGYQVSRAGAGVLLFSGSGALLREYAADATGLAAACAASTAGDEVNHPDGTIALTSTLTIPAGVLLRGRGKNSVLSVSGCYVLVNGKLADCTVYQSANTSDDVINVIADTGAILSHVDITLIQVGAGKALGLLGIAETAEAPADAYDCNINVSNTGGGSEWEYAGTVAGNIRLHQGSAVGSWTGA